ncbi:hypothetical protein [Prauserella cavernicola]|uniref:Uncharacterized protein n=1 Tax=Prauserella cavernicola TaxID=2800127 RepID=A0A934V608_9PSEU|nr:hypothetical protein [Prauserella cavernicola]MBK1787047.1 hypothetical protein [Prauserella cavernicola]
MTSAPAPHGDPGAVAPVLFSHPADERPIDYERLSSPPKSADLNAPFGPGPVVTTAADEPVIEAHIQPQRSARQPRRPRRSRS